MTYNDTSSPAVPTESEEPMNRFHLRPLIEPVHEPNLFKPVWDFPIPGAHMHIRPEGVTRWDDFGETPSQLQTYLNHVDAHRKAHQ